MKTETSLKLPLRETFKRTYLQLFGCRELFMAVLPILAAFIVLQLLFPLLFPCEGENCGNTWYNYVMSFAFSVFVSGIVVNFCRQIILKASPDFTSKSFWKATIFSILLRWALWLVFMFCAVVVCIFFFAISQNQDITAILSFPNILLINIALLAIAIFGTPLLLMLPAIAVEDYKWLSIKKLFKLVRGNHNRLFWGLVLVLLPCIILLVVILVALFSIYDSHSGGMGILSIVFNTLTVFVSGAYYANVYQFFKFIENKKQ